VAPRLDQLVVQYVSALANLPEALARSRGAGAKAGTSREGIDPLVKQSIRALLARLGYRVEGIRYTPRHLLDPQGLRSLEFDDVVCRHMYENGAECIFVQVGAYDGVSTDPLRKYIARSGWRGVMLEPQPGPADQLRTLYPEGSGVVVMEAALDRERGTRTLYTVEPDGLPKWAGGMASFDRAHILKHEYLIPGIAGLVRERRVPCVTFDDVLRHLPGDRLDVLQIDAEGADGYLLSLFPFGRIRPAIVHWEIKNMTRAEQEDTLDLLRGRGYRIARSGAEDMLAVLESIA
jgi:FkbM family methyltransferase